MTTPRLEPITPSNIDAVCAVRIHEKQEPYVELSGGQRVARRRL